MTRRSLLTLRPAVAALLTITLLGPDGEADLAGAISAARLANGVPAPLAVDYLNVMARGRALEQSAQGFLSHRPLLILQPWGEILEFNGELQSGQTTRQAVEFAVNGFLASPPHRAILLDPERRGVGVGLAQDSRGRLYVAAIFTQTTFEG